jgi:hypothetical protein
MATAEQVAERKARSSCTWNMKAYFGHLKRYISARKKMWWSHSVRSNTGANKTLAKGDK